METHSSTEMGKIIMDDLADFLGEGGITAQVKMGGTEVGYYIEFERAMSFITRTGRVLYVSIKPENEVLPRHYKYIPIAHPHYREKILDFLRSVGL